MQGTPFLPRAPDGTAAAPRRVVPPAFGALAELVGDGAVTDVLVNGTEVWADRGDGTVPQTGIELRAEETRALATRLIALAGRHVDEATPCVDARLGDGIRVHVVLPPVAVGGVQLSIRLPAVRRLGMAELDELGCFGGRRDGAPTGVRSRLEALVRSRANVLISGGTGTGKTTLLAAMLALAGPRERILIIEDVAEARIAHPHVVSLETRQANLEGAGRIDLPRLVREALRMRPDRLALGECRGAEIRELLAALNTGHDGGIGTIHANSLDDVPARLEALGALAGLDPIALARQAVSAIDAVVHLERHRTGRRVAAIGELGLGADGRLTMRSEA